MFNFGKMFVLVLLYQQISLRISFTLDLKSAHQNVCPMPCILPKQEAVGPLHSKVESKDVQVGLVNGVWKTVLCAMSKLQLMKLLITITTILS